MCECICIISLNLSAGLPWRLNHTIPRNLPHNTPKGMVGLSVRYYDASLALITAHFASDSKGRNRVAKRNRVRACVM